MKHDPMCPMTSPDGYLCCCNLIARVREDERKQYAAKWYSQQELDAAVAAAQREGANQGYLNGVATNADNSFKAGVKAAREAVAAHIRADLTGQEMFCGRKRDILAVIDGCLTEGRSHDALPRRDRLAGGRR